MELVRVNNPKILAIDVDDQIRSMLLGILQERYDCWEVGSAEGGFSSLSYLKCLPIDTLKVDKSFNRDVSTDSDDRSAVMAIVVTLTHNLRLKVGVG